MPAFRIPSVRMSTICLSLDCKWVGGGEGEVPYPGDFALMADKVVEAGAGVRAVHRDGAVGGRGGGAAAGGIVGDVEDLVAVAAEYVEAAAAAHVPLPHRRVDAAGKHAATAEAQHRAADLQTIKPRTFDGVSHASGRGLRGHGGGGSSAWQGATGEHRAGGTSTKRPSAAHTGRTHRPFRTHDCPIPLNCLA